MGKKNSCRGTISQDDGVLARSEGVAVRATVARFAFLSQSAPKLTEGLPLAERIHAALVSLSDGAPVFTGCDAHKRPLSGHRHAYILCESCPSEPKQEEITHVTVYARMGFGLRRQMASIKGCDSAL